jgi:hypothetical protein
MNVGDEHSRSLWMDVDVAPNAARLTRAITCDTVIIGSGLAGLLTTAYELSGRARRSSFSRRGKIGKGMTGAPPRI